MCKDSQAAVSMVWDVSPCGPTELCGIMAQKTVIFTYSLPSSHTVGKNWIFNFLTFKTETNMN
jgi:hypothetical protein